MTASASIVIPTFNRMHYLRRAIDAALAQTHPCEVVVCDHGSTDGTPQLARSYGDRVRYVRRETDQGPVACWRDGVEQASGEYCLINYDDDWVEPRFMQCCIESFDPAVGLVYAGVRLRDPAGAPLELANRHPPGRRSMRDLERFLLRTDLTLSPGCALFRRRDVLANLLPQVPGAAGRFGPRTGVGEDALLFLLTARDYPAYVHLPAALVNFTAHPQSITIDALTSGKRQALLDAYAHAKAWYRAQLGAGNPRGGMAKWLDLVRWHAAAGTLGAAAREVFRR